MLQSNRASVAMLAALIALGLSSGLSSGCGHSPEASHETRTETGAPSASAPAAASAADVRATPPFYRVAGGRGATLLLLGTIHLGPEQGWTLSPAVESGIATADQIALEVDLRLATEDAVSTLVAEVALLGPGQQISDVVAPETAKLLEEEDETLTRLGVPPGMRKRMKPWFMATVLGESIYAEVGLSSASAVEYHVLESLGARPLIGLETFEEQLRIFDSLSPELQDLMLRETLLHLDEARTMVEELVHAWRTGDEAELARLAREGIDELPELDGFYDIVLGDRNRNWVGQLSRLLDDREQAGDEVLVAVGALHLVGRDSLVELLREAGYRVEKVPQQVADR